MSKCISSHGEYSEHEVKEGFSCEWCGVFDERAALDRIEALEAERDRAEKLHQVALVTGALHAVSLEDRAEKAEAALARVKAWALDEGKGIDPVWDDSQAEVYALAMQDVLHALEGANDE